MYLCIYNYYLILFTTFTSYYIYIYIFLLLLIFALNLSHNCSKNYDYLNRKLYSFFY